jgi:lysophospholipase L1-like esterase
MNRKLVFTAALACIAAGACTAKLSAQTTATPPAENKDIEQMRARLADWPALGRYRDENATLPNVGPNEKRVVFFGDSITDSWGRHIGVFFPGENYINRGISGQTTPQMLIRFQQDVVYLHPAVVVILAGTNDIAGNTGPSTPQMILDNFESMAAIAKQNNIKLVIASVLPATAYPWRAVSQAAEKIRQLNQALKELCSREGLIYLDYYSAMADEQGGMRPGLSSDGVHPTAKGYEIMTPLAAAAIKKALQE